MHPNEPTAIESLAERFGGLLRHTADLLDGEVQLWSQRLELVLAVPGRTPAERWARLHEIVRRVAAHHESVRLSARDGEVLLGLPVRCRRGLSAVVTARLPRPRPAISAESHGAAPRTAALLGELARTMGEHLDLLQAHASAAAELVQQRTESDLLQRVQQRLAFSDDLRATFSFILEQCRAATGAELALLSLPDCRLFVTRQPGLAGRCAWIDRGLVQQIGARIEADLPRLPRRAIAGPLPSLLQGPWPLPEIAHLALAPLTRRDCPVGYLALLRLGESAFAPQELHLLEALAAHTVLGMRGGEMEEHRNAALLATVKALVATIEAKDSHTCGHSTRVHLLSMLLGKELGLAPAALESLQWASILHDVGKIGMPESILRKPAALTPEEYDVVKQHPQRGYQVLHHIHQLQDAAQAVLLHHERYAGGGYPLGLAGDGIPRAARIIAVADTFDALISTRPYRASRSEDEAFAEIRRVRGSQLDPEIVDALETMLPFLRENVVMLESTAHSG